MYGEQRSKLTGRELKPKLSLQQFTELSFYFFIIWKRKHLRVLLESRRVKHDNTLEAYLTELDTLSWRKLETKPRPTVRWGTGSKAV